METSNINIRNVPADLKLALKVQAAIRGMTLQALMLEIMQAATKKGK